MLDRANFAFGWACPAGHVEDEEEPEQALAREAKEEVGIDVRKYKLILHEFIEWNECKRGAKGHDWFVYEVSDWSGGIRGNFESKGLKWIGEDEIKNMQLEPVWEHFHKKLDLFK